MYLRRKKVRIFAHGLIVEKKRGTQLINVPTYDVKKKDEIIVINSDVLKNFRVMLHKKKLRWKKILHLNKPKSFHHIIQLLMHDNSYTEF